MALKKAMVFPVKKSHLRPKIVSVVTWLFILATLTATGAAQGEWIKKHDTPRQGGHGEAVVGTGDHVYVARCLRGERGWDTKEVYDV